MDILSKIEESSQFIKSKYNKKIEIGIILGTGLSDIVKDIERIVTINYKDIPNFPVSTVEGHAGEFIIGKLNGKITAVLNGRVHYYEGYSMEQVTFAVRVLKKLGINDLIISNAAGGMNPDFNPGDLMIITDHINFLGTNPLIGRNYEEIGPRFPDMSNAYDKKLVKLALKAAENLDIKVRTGVYLAVSGPSYETPAELRMFRKVGGDAVGMSTVPEVIAANHMGMNVLGISCITDMAIPDNLQVLDHEKVIETANKSMKKFVSLVKEIVRCL